MEKEFPGFSLSYAHSELTFSVSQSGTYTCGSNLIWTIRYLDSFGILVFLGRNLLDLVRLADFWFQHLKQTTLWCCKVKTWKNEALPRNIVEAGASTMAVSLTFDNNSIC